MLPRLMTGETAHLIKCLQQIHKTSPLAWRGEMSCLFNRGLMCGAGQLEPFMAQRVQVPKECRGQEVVRFASVGMESEESKTALLLDNTLVSVQGTETIQVVAPEILKKYGAYLLLLFLLVMHDTSSTSPVEVISKANEILAGISHPSVCSEVLLSRPGTAYILGLSEVYRVSKRLEDGAKIQQLASELLQHTLREVDLAWNNLLSFLVLGHPMFQMLLLEPSGKSNAHLSGPNLALSHVCGVCLTEAKEESEVRTGNSDPVLYQGSYYHASCANFWLNCVDSTLPREK